MVFWILDCWISTNNSMFVFKMRKSRCTILNICKNVRFNKESNTLPTKDCKFKDPFLTILSKHNLISNQKLPKNFIIKILYYLPYTLFLFSYTKNVSIR